MKPNILRAAIAAATLVSACSYAAGLTLYTQPDFGGQQHAVRGEDPNLANSGIQDQASSAVVDFGHWQVCTQPEFKGDCMVLGPGEYARLDPRVFHRIESARRVGDRGGDRYSTDEAGALELFAGTAFRGRLMGVERDIPRLGRGGVGVASLVVNEGTWQLCSEPGFQGDCEVYERGRYRDVGRLNNQVASIRRVG